LLLLPVRWPAIRGEFRRSLEGKIKAELGRVYLPIPGEIAAALKDERKQVDQLIVDTKQVTDWLAERQQAAHVAELYGACGAGRVPRGAGGAPKAHAGGHDGGLHLPARLPPRRAVGGANPAGQGRGRRRPEVRPGHGRVPGPRPPAAGRVPAGDVRRPGRAAP